MAYKSGEPDHILSYFNEETVSDCLKELPSPEALKHRIIISTKPPKDYLEAQTAKDNENNSRRKDSDDDVWGKEPSSLSIHNEADDKSDNAMTELNPSFEEDDDD
ncbi:hypothetical protein BUALT_Bualt13G0090200 [Buddleja alternifolia]|uniref:Uncharacterized protein n=1 Tax=Buddleja alternifolia TaxID=168488 RepID=A0AAV6WMP0_9LAMI|nr:hypothetical protein BUALT_Bualt13G0090200 [Buddleja alternifolia]